MLTETKSLYSYSQAVVELYIVKSSTCYSVNKNSFFFSSVSLCAEILLPSPSVSVSDRVTLILKSSSYTNHIHFPHQTDI